MIWCVEDDASIRDIELYTLRSTGFEERGFEDGVAFLAALEKQMPELVILDVMLPARARGKAADCRRPDGGFGGADRHRGWSADFPHLQGV